jgi:aspartyl protease family protein
MSKKAGLGMIAIAWIMLFIIASIAIDEWLVRRQNPNRSPQSHQGEHGERRVVLKANRHHQYLSSAQINGHPITLLVDTGATEVVIPSALAQQLQLPVGPPGYATTANGRVRVNSTHIDEIIIGSIVLRNVAATINPGMSKGDAALLGMSALKTIELRQRDGELLLIQSAMP